MPDTPRLGLPLMAAAQAQKHVTHNDALLSLDALTQISALETDRNTPPAAPNEGDIYIVGNTPTGAFVGQSGRLALYVSAAWKYFAPKAGWMAYIAKTQKLVVHDGTRWRGIEELQTSSAGVIGLGIGTSFDDANPLSAKLNSALFTAKAVAEGGTGDLRFNLNKEKTTGTVSQLYQTAWSGRAETGLTGDDKWRLKVSADGTTWRDVLIADPATGAVRIDTFLAGRSVPGFAARSEVDFTGPAMGGLSLNDKGTGTNPAIAFRRAGVVVGSISISGTGVAFNTTSDYRLKTDWHPLPDALGMINRLNVWRYSFKSAPDERVHGFLAHELAAVLPSAVRGEKDGVDEAGSPLYQSVDLMALVPVLTAAIQSLSARVTALENPVGARA